MGSREQILAAVAAVQPAFKSLPEIAVVKDTETDLHEKFTTVLTAIGGKIIQVDNYAAIAGHLNLLKEAGDRLVSNIIEISEIAEMVARDEYPHVLADVEYAVLKACFGVAENGAVWITESLMENRVTPFICQHLIIVLDAREIVANMHEAYEKIGNETYGFGTFISGPSKTADIEQSLVLGAHGPKTMTIFLLNNI
jgi:L-lactate dehydrogenase complex protein LldG